MTIKQIIVGVSLGAAALALCLHQFSKEATDAKRPIKVVSVAKPTLRKTDRHRVAFSRIQRKPVQRKQDSEAQLSSRFLY